MDESIMNESTIVTVASLIGSFGAAVLVFRVQREASMDSGGEITWIPWADRLLLTAVLSSLLLGVFPVLSGLGGEVVLRLATASTSAAVWLLAGYVLAILGHYRLILGRRRTGARSNPEPAERWITWITVGMAAVAFIVAYT